MGQKLHRPVANGPRNDLRSYKVRIPTPKKNLKKLYIYEYKNDGWRSDQLNEEKISELWWLPVGINPIAVVKFEIISKNDTDFFHQEVEDGPKFKIKSANYEIKIHADKASSDPRRFLETRKFICSLVSLEKNNFIDYKKSELFILQEGTDINPNEVKEHFNCQLSPFVEALDDFQQPLIYTIDWQQEEPGGQLIYGWRYFAKDAFIFKYFKFNYIDQKDRDRNKLAFPIYINEPSKSLNLPQLFFMTPTMTSIKECQFHILEFDAWFWEVIDGKVSSTFMPGIDTSKGLKKEINPAQFIWNPTTETAAAIVGLSFSSLELQYERSWVKVGINTNYIMDFKMQELGSFSSALSNGTKGGVALSSQMADKLEPEISPKWQPLARSPGGVVTKGLSKIREIFSGSVNYEEMGMSDLDPAEDINYQVFFQARGKNLGTSTTSYFELIETAQEHLKEISGPSIQYGYVSENQLHNILGSDTFGSDEVYASFWFAEFTGAGNISSHKSQVKVDFIEMQILSKSSSLLQIDFFKDEELNSFISIPLDKVKLANNQVADRTKTRLYI